METTHTCQSCGTANIVDVKNIQEVSARDDRGINYRLLAYKCQSCGELNIVQIDDEESLLLLRRVTAESAKMGKKLKEGKKILKSEVEKSKKLNKRLDKKRKMLKENVEVEKLEKNI